MGLIRARRHRRLLIPYLVRAAGLQPSVQLGVHLLVDVGVGGARRLGLGEPLSDVGLTHDSLFLGRARRRSLLMKKLIQS